MSLQYLEALKSLGQSPATKFVIPLEFTKLVEPFTAYVERASDGGGPMTAGGAPTADSPSQGTTADGSGGSGAPSQRISRGAAPAPEGPTA